MIEKRLRDQKWRYDPKTKEVLDGITMHDEHGSMEGTVCSVGISNTQDRDGVVLALAPQMLKALTEINDIAENLMCDLVEALKEVE